MGIERADLIEKITCEGPDTPTKDAIQSETGEAGCFPINKTLEASGSWPPLDCPPPDDLVVGAGQLSHRVLVQLSLGAAGGRMGVLGICSVKADHRRKGKLSS